VGITKGEALKVMAILAVMNDRATNVEVVS